MPEHKAQFPPPRRKPSLDFSFTGLVYAAMMLFMGIAAMNSQANLLFGVFGLMIGVLLVSGSISRTVIRRISATRDLPEHFVVGSRATIQYRFHNRKRFWPSLSVTLSELEGTEAFTRQPQSYMLHAAAGMTAVVPVELVPQRRGVYHLDRHQLSTSFPFGFIKRAVERRSGDDILVYPAIGKVAPALLAKAVSAEQAGAANRPRRGGADEFYGVSEFRTGQNPRFINWRRSARTGVLVANEMTLISPPRLMVLVDTCRADASSGETSTALERAIAMAGSMVMQTLDQNLAVGLCAWSGEWIMINPSRGKRHCRDLMSILAQLPRNTEHDLSELLAEWSRLERSAATGFLFTHRQVDSSLGQVARGNWVVVSSVAPQAEQWFHFDPTVDFSACSPLTSDD